MILRKCTPGRIIPYTSKFIIIIFDLVLLITISCDSNSKSAYSENIAQVMADALRSNNNRHAKGFRINYFNDYKEITVSNPWQKASNVHYRYILTENRKNIPEEILKNAQVFNIPVKKVICLSTTHIAILDLLGEANTIVGVSGTDNISNKTVRKLIIEGRISDIGYDQNLNYELILSLKPDLVLTYGVGGETAGYINKLKDLGIGVVINAEYLEETVLAKAEWIKFIAAFYNLEDLADKRYAIIEKEYSLYRQLVDSVKNKPKILVGLPWKGTWYVPGGNSHIAKLISDSGGEILWKDNTSGESMAMSMESVFEKAQEADIWINTGSANTKSDILFVDKRLENLQVFREGTLYNNNALQNKYGGNDYWESGVMNPHTILKDMIKIFHPDILPDHVLVYYKKIE